WAAARREAAAVELALEARVRGVREAERGAGRRAWIRRRARERGRRRVDRPGVARGRGGDAVGVERAEREGVCAVRHSRATVERAERLRARAGREGAGVELALQARVGGVREGDGRAGRVGARVRG